MIKKRKLEQIKTMFKFIITLCIAIIIKYRNIFAQKYKILNLIKAILKKMSVGGNISDKK